MKRVCLILAAVLACLLSCSKKGGRTIPADDLAEIYVDMLMVDQWVRSNSGITRTADTSLVYEPIIRRHGYTRDDYIRTVEIYLQRPEDFAEIFEKTRTILQRRSDQLTALDDYRNQVEGRTDYRRAPVFAVTGDPTLSVRIDLDSLGVYCLERVQADTLYEGLIRIVRDSIRTDAVADSLAAADSVVVETLPAEKTRISETPAEKTPVRDSAGKHPTGPRKKIRNSLNEKNSSEIPVPVK